MIVVFGATGTIGDELISILSGEGVPAIAVTRSRLPPRPLPGIRWVQADLAEPDSLNGLFGGVRSLFLLTGNHPDMFAPVTRVAMAYSPVLAVMNSVCLPLPPKLTFAVHRSSAIEIRSICRPAWSNTPTPSPVR